MDAMFSTPLQLAQQLDFIEAVVAVGVAHPVKAAIGVFVDHDVETVKRVQESVRLADWQINRLVLNWTAGSNGRRHDTIEFSVLIAYDEPALGIDAQRHPGTLCLLGHGVQKFDFEILRDL